jgi:hypothetical protein
MNNTFRCKSIVAVPRNNGTPTKEQYLIDVRVYDNNIDPDFTTSHWDRSYNYTAFVSFSNTNLKPNIGWNIEPKVEISLPDSTIWLEVMSRIKQYKKDHEDEIIKIATQYFNSKYPHLV